MSTPEHGFVEARREIEGVTVLAERRVLAWLAPRVPGRVTSDHLTLVGLIAMAACGLLYVASSGHPWRLLLVDVALAVNWLGDSLDGTLARHRGCPRPRFGFYVDHLADAFGALFLLAGLAGSGLVSPLVAAGLLAAYLLLSVETHLATYALGNFKVSWGPVGGTELRILLAVLNVAVMVKPTVSLGGRNWLSFDLVGLSATAGLLLVATIAGVRGTLALARLEGWAPAVGTPTPTLGTPTPTRGDGLRHAEA